MVKSKFHIEMRNEEGEVKGGLKRSDDIGSKDMG